MLIRAEKDDNDRQNGGMRLFFGEGDRGWSALVRRTDLKSESRFGEMHQKEVSAGDVRAFLPHLDLLTWNPTKDRQPDLGSRGELKAVDGEYMIYLLYPSTSFFSAEGVREDFASFMR